MAESANSYLIADCYACQGTGKITTFSGESECVVCGGDGKVTMGALDLPGVMDKLNDILDKCNDIFEKVSE
jgi:RecJ-like exonuclease